LFSVGNVTGPVLTAYSMRSVMGVPTERGLAADALGAATTTRSTWSAG
jgi:hypothetical protein